MTVGRPIPPVALFIFNRPETTARVFAAVRQARPERLLIVADGPREGVPDEPERCNAARQVASGVDWPCQVQTNISEVNLGCRRRVSSGLDWVFNQVEEAIILEDDCVPHPDFFLYCSTLLDRFRDEERVMHIGGCNFQEGRQRGDGSYYFSRYTHVWGWASWRRAWQHYDLEMRRFHQFVNEERIAGIFPDQRMQRQWLKNFCDVADRKIDTWDFQWVFAIWCADGLAISPNRNLVANIGFGAGASNTNIGGQRFNDRPTYSLGEIVHPAIMTTDLAADLETYRFFRPTFGERLAGLMGAIRRRL